jgi:hypothetical protein
MQCKCSLLTQRQHLLRLRMHWGLLIQQVVKALSQAIKRNRGRFPSDFLFKLTAEEAEELNRSQSVTSSLRSQFVTSNMKVLDPPPLPPDPAPPEIGFHVKEDAVPYRTKRKVTSWLTLCNSGKPAVRHSGFKI